jgi:kynurenine formamidase
MPLLQDLLAALEKGKVEVIDLTAPLSENTPIIQLPPPFSNTRRFELSQISHYDEKGPAWYWNDIATGEHVGTHFDAPIHWVTGRDKADVSQVPATRLIAPAVVIDKSKECSQNPDYLLEVADIQRWER